MVAILMADVFHGGIGIIDSFILLKLENSVRCSAAPIVTHVPLVYGNIDQNHYK